MSRRIKALLVSAALSTLSFAAVPAVQADEVYLGGIDFNRYCEDRYGPTASATLPWRWFNTNPHSWQCVGSRSHMIDIVGDAKAAGPKLDNVLVGTKPVDFSEACRMQYGEDATAVLDDDRDPYSWTCMTEVFPEVTPPANVG